MIKLSKKKVFVGGIIVSFVMAIIVTSFSVPIFFDFIRDYNANIQYMDLFMWLLPPWFIIFEIANLSYIFALNLHKTDSKK